MRYVISVSLVVVAIIHLAPVMGVLGNERLAKLYGIAIADNNLSILMRHRAILFGMLGGFLLVAAFRPELQLTALALGYISVISFLLIAWSTGDYNPEIARVVTADLIALAALMVGSGAWVIMRRGG